MSATNSNQANQYKPDPRQSLFLQNYLNPKSKTFSNACQSAIAAGYSKEYAENIMALYPEWLSVVIGDDVMLKKAEKNLDKAMEIDVTDPQIGERALKASMFVAKGLGKAKYSERTELTGKDGEKLFVSEDDVKKALENLKK